MEGKYFFNGKDISMNLYIQIRDVIDIIMEKSNLSFLLLGIRLEMPQRFRYSFLTFFCLCPCEVSVWNTCC